MIVHDPPPVRCTVPGEGVVTLQLPAAANVTGNPEDALALTVKSTAPNTLFGKAAKLIV